MKERLCALLLAAVFVSCSGSGAEKRTEAKPTLSVFGFSCEMGGKKCRDRRVGREMRKWVMKDMAENGRFVPMQEKADVKKHMLDVSDMLWTSGESDVLADMVQLGAADYLLYGRVFEFDTQTRILKIELTLVERASGRKISTIGNGEDGSLEAAVADAVEKLGYSFDEFLKRG